MGLFDIFKRKKKNEQEEAVQDKLIQENKAENGEESGVGEDVTAETDLTNDTAVELETETAEPETGLADTDDEVFAVEKTAAETETAEAAETEIIAETASVMPEAEDGVAENDDSMDEAEEIPAEQETEEAPADESTDGYVIDENDGSEEDCEKFVEKPKEKLGFFGRLKLGLKKTRDDFGGKMASVFTFGRTTLCPASTLFSADFPALTKIFTKIWKKPSFVPMSACGLLWNWQTDCVTVKKPIKSRTPKFCRRLWKKKLKAFCWQKAKNRTKSKLKTAS